MSTRKYLTAAALGFALMGLILAGCVRPPVGPPDETNEDACLRLFDYFNDCVPREGPAPPGFDFDRLVEVTCGLAPEKEECNFPALTNCMIANTTCDTIGVGDSPAVCMGVQGDCRTEGSSADALSGFLCGLTGDCSP